MLTFELVTLSGVKFSEQVHEVLLPTPDGMIAVFSNHMPLVSLVVPGVIGIRRREKDSDEKLEQFAGNGGVVEVSSRLVRVLVDEADTADEIVIKEAEAALERAKEQAKLARDQVTIDQANQIIQTQQARLKLAGLRRRKHQ